MQIIYYGTLAFGISLFCALQRGVGTGLSLWGVGLSMLGALGLALWLRRGALQQVCLVSFFILLGLLNGLRVGPSAGELLQPYFGKEVTLLGRVELLSCKAGSGYTSLILECEGLQQGNTRMPYSGRVRLSLPAQDTNADAAGNKKALQGNIIVQGRLEPLEGLKNPGSFDGELYNRINNLGGRLTKARIISRQLQGKAGVSPWQAFTDRLALLNLSLRQRLEQLLGKERGGLLGSMLLGGSKMLEEETREIFTSIGLAHLLSVSGTHLVLLASFLGLVLKPLPRPWRKGLLIIMLSLYALLCGLRPPVVRALLMSIIVIVSVPNGNTVDSKEAANSLLKRVQSGPLERGVLLCLVALVLLLVKPLWVLDMGFQLSFGATGGLIWLLPACQRRLEGLLPDFLAEGLGITMAAQLGTFPVIIGNFYQISWLGLVSNLLFVPVLELVALLAALGLSLCQVGLAWASGLGTALLELAGFLLQQLLVQGSALRALPYGELILGSLPVWCAVVYYAFILVWADLPVVQFLRNTERRLVLLGLGLVLVVCCLWRQYAPQAMTVYFLDCGQGDCVVLVSPKRQIFVYDTGGLQGLDTGKRVLLPFLYSLGKQRVEALILSHYDFDHVGGAASLLKGMEVEQLVLPRERLDENSRSLLASIIMAAKEKGTKITSAEQGQSWSLGEGSSLNVTVPASIIEQSSTSSISALDEGVSGNDASTVLSLRTPHGSLLLTGDLSSEVEEQLRWEPHTALKAAHHGSRFSNSEMLLQQLQPKVCVISCGRNNRYQHPHLEVLERLQAVGCKIYRTDLQGALKLVFDESGVKCYSYIYDGF